ncbi:MAG: 3-deoxy-manno-octulosonate cytidylyltransferase [Gammaproteobacteria bacterium]|nr:3-deoxy-manno-octulosonate cytidylyltransferase [Gammaproteobacteria bacterium]
MSCSFKVVIPARYSSTRLPGKPLLNIAGMPMIQHVYNQAIQSGADEVVIATDDSRIEKACASFSALTCMTDVNHQSGTDRIAEVLSKMQWSDDTIIVNVQGDEPLLPPSLIRQVANDLAKHSDASIATLCTPVQTSAELLDPHVVKVIMDHKGNAMYFSRAPIPWDRDAFERNSETLPDDSEHYRHIGLYAYRASFIRDYNSIQSCYLEKAESLEQLRALWSGHVIRVSVTSSPPGHGVDTQEDLDRVHSLLIAN